MSLRPMGIDVSALVVATAVALLVGCGGGGKKASPDTSTAITETGATQNSSSGQVNLSQKYLAMVAPANAALAAFENKEKSYARANDIRPRPRDRRLPESRR
jgi:hypothetical protein